ncbi:MAG: glycosyltransferase, partial [Candidatus Orphnella occulta]|nr:glycosyltransferase [Candidatus Orphnella occulta]
CKHLSRQLKIDRFVTFPGMIDNSKIGKIYKKIDVLVVPSIWPENSPVTIMEALASGTPVLASDIGGIPELVDHSINGLLHKYDDPASLADNIRKIIKDPEIVGILSKSCIEKVKKYDLKRQVEIIVNEYKRITNCYD